MAARKVLVTAGFIVFGCASQKSQVQVGRVTLPQANAGLGGKSQGLLILASDLNRDGKPDAYSFYREETTKKGEKIRKLV